MIVVGIKSKEELELICSCLEWAWYSGEYWNKEELIDLRKRIEKEGGL